MGFLLASFVEAFLLEAAVVVVVAGPFLTVLVLDLLLVKELDFFEDVVVVDVLLDVFNCIGPVLDDLGLSGSIFRAFLALATMPVLIEPDLTCKIKKSTSLVSFYFRKY